MSLFDSTNPTDKSMLRQACFTICSWNYFGYARTLRNSLKQSNPDLPFYIFIADADSTLIPETERHQVIVVNKEIAPEFESMAMRYSIMEFNTSIKPHCFEYLFDRLGFELATYLDPDILVIDSIAPIYDNLARHADCVLTPHITQPLSDGGHPDDLVISRAGIYNLGFAGFANRPKSRDFLQWWRTWLNTDCVVDFPRGVFVDQRFCDFAPAFIPRTIIEHDPGYNIAYWNLPHRPITLCEGKLYAAKSPVKFIHFSGVNKNDPKIFSKYQDRYKGDALGELQPIYDYYIDQLKANDKFGDRRFSEVKYGLGLTRDGQKVIPLMAACADRHQAELRKGSTTLIDLGADFYSSPSSLFSQPSVQPVGKLLMEAYQSRPDLQAAFDVTKEDGRYRLNEWSAQRFEAEYDVPHTWALSREWIAAHMANKPADAAPQANPMQLPARRSVASRAVSKGRSILRRMLESGPTPAAPTPAPALVGQIPQGTRSTRTPGLAIYGFLQAETGVGQSGRALADAFTTTGLPLSKHTFNPPEFQNSIAFEAGKTFSNHMTHALLAINADNVLHLSNHMNPVEVKDNTRIGLFFWELPVFPGIWAGAAERVDEVWVSSEFVAQSLRTNTHKPIHVVPLPIPINKRSTQVARQSLGLPEDRLMYLTTFDFNSYPSRKNPMAVVRAFMDAFPAASASSPLLIVKCHGIQNRGRNEAELKELASHNKNIQIMDRVLSADEMLALQAAADVYVSLHRSEGFGLNLAEAMAAGKLAIGTAFSGNMEFMNSSNSLLVGYDMKALEEGDYVFWNGQWWADPHHDEAVAALLKAQDAALRSRLGAAAQAYVAEHLSSLRIGARMAELLR